MTMFHPRFGLPSPPPHEVSHFPLDFFALFGDHHPHSTVGFVHFGDFDFDVLVDLPFFDDLASLRLWSPPPLVLACGMSARYLACSMAARGSPWDGTCGHWFWWPDVWYPVW